MAARGAELPIIVKLEKPEAVARLRDILDEYLSFSRPLDKIRAERLSLGSLTDEVLAVMAGRAEEAGIALARTGDADAVAVRALAAVRVRGPVPLRGRLAARREAGGSPRPRPVAAGTARHPRRGPRRERLGREVLRWASDAAERED